MRLLKKYIVSAAAVVLLAFLCVPASALETPWDSKDIHINVAETFSDMQNGEVVWDQGIFWTGTPFYEWPAAKWQDGQLVFTDFMGLDSGEDTRMTFRIQTNEMSLAEASGSIGMGFYVENNTDKEQSVGFYMVGMGCCLKNKNGTSIYFFSVDGSRTESVVGDAEMAIIPPGQKGYVVAFYEDFTNLWSSDAYNPDTDPVRMPGFELTNLRVDGSKGETVVLDNVFFFGSGCVDNNNGIITVNTEPGQNTPGAETPAPEETQSAQPEQTEPAQASPDASVRPEKSGINGMYIAAGVIAVLAVAAVVIALIAGKKKEK